MRRYGVKYVSARAIACQRLLAQKRPPLPCGQRLSLHCLWHLAASCRRAGSKTRLTRAGAVRELRRLLSRAGICRSGAQIGGRVEDLAGLREPMVRIHLPPADSPSLSGFPPPLLEKPRFSAIVAAVRGGSVGRDAQSPATSRRGEVVSLSDDIPVPQRCRRRFGEIGATGRNEVGLKLPRFRGHRTIWVRGVHD